MDTTAIIVSTITQIAAIIIACGGWFVALKKTRIETSATVQKGLDANYQKVVSDLRTDMGSLKDDISGVNATIQQQMAIMEVKVETLSDRVERHNKVIDRTYALEARMGKVEQATEDIHDYITAKKGAWE